MGAAADRELTDNITTFTPDELAEILAWRRQMQHLLALVPAMWALVFPLYLGFGFWGFARAVVGGSRPETLIAGGVVLAYGTWMIMMIFRIGLKLRVVMRLDLQDAVVKAKDKANEMILREHEANQVRADVEARRAALAEDLHTLPEQLEEPFSDGEQEPDP